ncbi:hypothetical protein SS1G_06119 [Sclerotinia sclerotiorum 1980 UF-70]|uniref:SnoaL-like domain-containing protein n=2 Tax=Sclerotinia sclerotiorum (strain ATCC 18683 / 1980 / Ss-1) TaxID=665079 RepID=A7ELC2_SCLS1|nr:hypothetical protein SS1G_06119 [Sclerotinia sclerotiorum 1980 UF-70]APA09703.1 hypothetical protein sscle_05g044730 [Sclerotinia sclerotiorum 1980 UF-70]EDO03638.1 hypothetical protein SS1G_06119 [Sclerotinia sclerotiorum 1980 UF-70]
MYIAFRIPLLIPLFLLPGVFSWSPFSPSYTPPSYTSPPSVSNSYSPLEQIRYTLAFETFLLDSKNWTALSLIYTTDAVANFSSLGAGVWTGRNEIIVNEQKALGAVAHGIHQITSSAILINPGNGGEAHVMSYYTFNHFDTNADKTAQHIFSAWFKYEDQWVDTGSYDGSPSSWRVKNRQVTLVGGSVGGDFGIEKP